PHQLEGLTVLAIDNEPQILDGMTALLTGWQCRVIAARCAREAAAQLLETGETPDVMLVDYHLDDGNGIDAIVQLRWRFGVAIPAILITADRSRAVRAEAAA